MKQWLIGLVLAGILFAGFIELVPKTPAPTSGTYYDMLKAGCANSDGPSCCLDSINRMEAGSYRPAIYPPSMNNPTCPAGQSIETLKCIGSRTWCHPEDNAPFFQGTVRRFDRIETPNGQSIMITRLGATCGSGGIFDIGGCPIGPTVFEYTINGTEGKSGSLTMEKNDSGYIGTTGIRIVLDGIGTNEDDYYAQIRAYRTSQT